MEQAQSRASSLSLDDILRPVCAELDEVERILLSWVAEAPPQVAGPMRHTLSAGGKRLRPGLVLLCAGLSPSARTQTRARALAAIVEIIHTSSLIHDDVVDEATLRRGLPSVPHRWSSKFALLVGDFWFSWAMKFLSSLASEWTLASDIVGEVARTVCRMSEAEVIQLTQDVEPATKEDYLRLASGKTGALLAACCRLGCWSWQASASCIEGAGRYGEHLGISFQIADDILDIRGDEGTTGKVALMDLHRSSISLPLILTRKRLDAATSEALDMGRSPGSGQVSPAEIRKIIESSGAIEEAIEEAERQSGLASMALEGCPQGPCLDSLQALSVYAIARAR